MADDPSANRPHLSVMSVEANAEDARESPAEPPPSRGWWRKIDRQTLAMIIVIKALIFVFAAVGLQTLTDERTGFEAMWHRWDSAHYRLLAESGYSATGEERFSLVFYPLFPWLVRCVAFVVRDFFASAVIVSGIAAVAAGLLLQRLTQLDSSPATARNAVWFLMIFPRATSCTSTIRKVCSSRS
jgi:hypothetical protein